MLAGPAPGPPGGRRWAARPVPGGAAGSGLGLGLRRGLGRPAQAGIPSAFEPRSQSSGPGTGPGSAACSLRVPCRSYTVSLLPFYLIGSFTPAHVDFKLILRKALLPRSWSISLHS